MEGPRPPHPSQARGGTRDGAGASGRGRRRDPAGEPVGALTGVHTGTVRTVLPGGRPAGAGHPEDGADDDRPAGATAVRLESPPARGRLDRWPGVLRVPLQVLGRTVAKAWHDRILGLSAEAAFWQILSVPPLLIGLLGTLGYLGTFIGEASVAQIEAELLRASTEVLTPDVVEGLVQPTLDDILGSGRLDLVSVGFLLSLWAGSSATATFMNTVVIAYDQRDVRGPIRTRLKALWLFVIGLLLAVLTLPLLVLGRGVLVSLLPADWRGTAMVLVNAVYWPVVLIGLLLALTSFYHVVLPRRLPWHRHLPGTVLAVAFFVVAALVTRAYVADILTTTLPYGALATPIAVLLFCFFFGMSVLLGAELNATIQSRWPAPLRRHQRRSQARRAAKLERARELQD
jgi:membrane protein